MNTGSNEDVTEDITLCTPTVPILNESDAVALAEAIVANASEPQEIRALAAYVIRVTPRPKNLPKGARTPNDPPPEVPDIASRFVRR